MNHFLFLSTRIIGDLYQIFFSVKTCVVKEAGLSGVLLLLDGVGGEGRVASASPSELLEFIL